MPYTSNTSASQQGQYHCTKDNDPSLRLPILDSAEFNHRVSSTWKNDFGKQAEYEYGFDSEKKGSEFGCSSLNLLRRYSDSRLSNFRSTIDCSRPKSSRRSVDLNCNIDKKRRIDFDVTLFLRSTERRDGNFDIGTIGTTDQIKNIQDHVWFNTNHPFPYSNQSSQYSDDNRLDPFRLQHLLLQSYHYQSPMYLTLDLIRLR